MIELNMETNSQFMGNILFFPTCICQKMQAPKKKKKKKKNIYIYI